MAKRKTVKLMPKKIAESPLAWLETALASRTKSELVVVIMEIARTNHGIVRQLESNLEIHPPSKDILNETVLAISDATDFDAREINRNFDYDYQAYETIKRNFGLLAKAGKYHDLMKLALDLMKQGSYQMEMSDEGLMCDDIEECVRVAIQGVDESDLPAKEVVSWCNEMSAKDRVGVVCDRELTALRERVAKNRK